MLDGILYVSDAPSTICGLLAGIGLPKPSIEGDWSSIVPDSPLYHVREVNPYEKVGTSV